MNIYRKLLRAWIAVASLIGFVFGWIFIARANETTFNANGGTAAQSLGLPPLPTVEALNSSTGSSNGQSVNIIPQQRRPQFSMRLRTGGS